MPGTSPERLPWKKFIERKKIDGDHDAGSQFASFGQIFGLKITISALTTPSKNFGLSGLQSEETCKKIEPFLAYKEKAVD